MKIILIFLIALFVILISCNKNDTSTNPTNNNIESVTIGTQVWMLKNLDVDHYRNGDPIPQVTDNDTWANLSTGAWCYYNNDPVLGNIYGKLYNYYALMDPRGLTPTGWHIPGNEWGILFEYVGKNATGGKLKEDGTEHWWSPNKGATNEYGFTALPGGSRNKIGKFTGINGSGYWWNMSNGCWFISMGSGIDDIGAGNGTWEFGYSVRCVKD